jgi:hypothetical protein
MVLLELKIKEEEEEEEEAKMKDRCKGKRDETKSIKKQINGEDFVLISKLIYRFGKALGNEIKL